MNRIIQESCLPVNTVECKHSQWDHAYCGILLDFSLKMCRNSILLTSPSSTNCKDVGVLSSYNELLSRFQPPLISNKWVSWWECFFLIQIQTNTQLRQQLALDSLRFLNLSECGGLTYSLKPCTHADSLSRFFFQEEIWGQLANVRKIGYCISRCAFSMRGFLS